MSTSLTLFVFYCDYDGTFADFITFLPLGTFATADGLATTVVGAEDTGVDASGPLTAVAIFITGAVFEAEEGSFFAAHPR